MRKQLAMAAITTATLITATAGAAQAMRPDDGPGSGATDTTKLNVTFTIPRNFVCNVAVRIHTTGTETDAFSLDAVTITSATPNERLTLTNLKTGKTIHRITDGSNVTRIRPDGSQLQWGFGRNLYGGKGVRGILLENGVQRFRITDPNDPVNSTIHWVSRVGSQEQVCRTLGARPVKGKNLASAAASAQSASIRGLR